MGLIQSVAGNNGASGNYGITIGATKAGSLLVMIEADYASAPSAPTIPTDTNGDTFLLAGTFLATGRLTVYYLPNCTAGNVLVTVKPASGASSAVVMEFDSIALANPLDAICGSLVAVTSQTTFTSQTLSSTQDVLAIGAVYNRAGSNASYAASGNWLALTDSPNSADGDELFTEYIFNGKKGHFTAQGTNASRSQWGALVLFKMAAPYPAEKGIRPSMLLDFETSSDATVLTNAIMLASTKGGNGSWALAPSTPSALTIATLAQQRLLAHVTLDGTRLPLDAGTRGVAFDPTQNTAMTATCTLQINSLKMSAGFFVKSPNATDLAAQFFSVFNINGAGGSDYAVAQFTAGVLLLECVSGDSAGITVQASKWYWVTLQYVQGGTHSLALYDADTLAQVGSLQQKAATGSFAPVGFAFGQTHNTTAGTGPYYFDNIIVDYVDAIFPLLPTERIVGMPFSGSGLGSRNIGVSGGLSRSEWLS